MKTDVFSIIAVLAMAAAPGSASPVAESDILEARSANLTARASSGTFQAYTTGGCGGSVGETKPFGNPNNPVCIATGGRHSYIVSAQDGCQPVVTLWDQQGCTGANRAGSGSTGVCHAVNDGRNWNSVTVKCA